MQIAGIFQCTCLKQHALAGIDGTTLCSCGARLLPIMYRHAEMIKNAVIAIESMPKDSQSFQVPKDLHEFDLKGDVG